MNAFQQITLPHKDAIKNQRERKEERKNERKKERKKETEKDRLTGISRRRQIDKERNRLTSFKR